MIQLIALRSFVAKETGKEQRYDKLLDYKLEIPSVDYLLRNVSKVLDQIPADKRWNIFYTVANCTDKKREFLRAEVIAFDLDGVDKRYADAYTSALVKILGVGIGVPAIVSSGNGLHFLVKLAEPVTDVRFFETMRPHYKAVCAKLERELRTAGLPVKEVDASVFEPRRILRLPGTTNRKPDRPDTLCELIQNFGGAVALDLPALSGIPLVEPSEAVDKKVLKRYPNTDPAAVLAGCEFLKRCAEKPNEIDEPRWYAALSIVARLDGQGSTGEERCHELSRGHRGYTREGTDEKIEQAMEASGPRTCKSINDLWGECSSCPHWQKLTSPITLRGAGTIPTEGTGFHNIPIDGKGKPTPNFEDLIAFFKRQTNFKVLGDSRQVYAWNTTHYVPIEKASLEAFAREHFDPKPTVRTMTEFRQRVEVANIVPVEWWEDTIKRKMNFLNGYLDIDTMDFRPHDQEIAFRHVLPYEYDPKAAAPTFDKMVDLVTGKDPDTRRVLEEYMGYALSYDDCWTQKALVLTGEGSNGKSTVLETLAALAGEGNYSTVNIAKIDEQYNLSQLDKKLFNISEETPQKALADNHNFKNLVTGGKIVVRVPYKAPYQIANRAKLILTCNDLPSSSDNSHGFYRRLIIVPFTQTIEPGTPGYDPRILDKLKTELPGIFNVAMRGYHRLVSQGRFSDSASARASLDEYRMENDTVLAWVRENLVVHVNGGYEEHFVAFGDLYAAYRDATRAAGRQPLDLFKFSHQLRRLRDTWGEKSYQERAVRKCVDVRGKSVRVRGLQGVGISEIN